MGVLAALASSRAILASDARPGECEIPLPLSPVPPFVAAAPRAPPLPMLEAERCLLIPVGEAVRSRSRVWYAKMLGEEEIPLGGDTGVVSDMTSVRYGRALEQGMCV